MKDFAKKLLAIFSIFSLTIFSSGCLGDDEVENPKMSLRVGTRLDSPPLEFYAENGKDYQGFEIDLIRAIAKRMNATVEIEDINFDALIPVLQSDMIDLAISGMTITNERSQSVLFSDPYYESGLTVLVKANNSSINSFDDLRGKRIATRVGSTGYAAARQIAGVNIIAFGDANEAVEELQNDEVDAVIHDRPVNDYLVKNNAELGFRSLPGTLSTEYYGIAVSKDNKELLQKINESLQYIRDSGEYDKIYSKWFGEN